MAVLSHSDLLKLKRWPTPTVYNGWEQITQHDTACGSTNIEETHDFMPDMGPMVGYAVTLVVEPSNPKHKLTSSWMDYYEYLASLPGPKIVCVQDLDKPQVIGSTWGEVTANINRALGCVGTITDGGVRDIDGMENAGFKAIARRLAVGHAHARPVRWAQAVEIFGTKVCPGQLVHADAHGFLVVPDEDQAKLLDAVQFMDELECDTMIAAARQPFGRGRQEILRDFGSALERLISESQERFAKP